MTPVDLSIVIVNWNSREFLRACLRSISGDTCDIRYEVIVVDSGSFDGCEQMLEQEFPDVRFIQSQRNIGFALANNLGAREARAPVLLFLNPDTEVSAGAIGKLYAEIEKLGRPGVLGARLSNTDGSLQTSCVQPLPTIPNQLFNCDLLLRAFPKIRLWQSAIRFEGAVSPVPVEAVSGACMMIRREVFESLGGYSADYFMYAEDLDLCHRTRAAGLVNYYVRAARIIHHGGGSTRQLSRFAAVMIPESVGRLLRKTRGEAYSVGYRVALCASAVGRLLLLGAGFPVALLLRRRSGWKMSLDKWCAVLSWGLGREGWAQHAIGREQHGRPVGSGSCAD